LVEDSRICCNSCIWFNLTCYPGANVESYYTSCEYEHKIYKVFEWDRSNVFKQQKIGFIVKTEGEYFYD
jgi:hypothetical protein